MSLTWEALADALERDDTAGVAELVRGASEQERKACAQPLLDLMGDRLPYERSPTFLVAVLGCLPRPHKVVGGLLWRLSDDVVDLAVDVLADRRPPWLRDFPAVLVDDKNATSGWLLARALVRSGLGERPDHPNYALHMIRDGLGRLRRDPGLLENEVWRLFEIEGASSQLYASWAETLAELARDGLIDRERLLDATLGAFLRDFKPSQVTWYLRMHDALEPTVDEIAARQATYRRVLATGASVAVGLAQQSLSRLLKETRLDVESWLAEAESPLHRKEKSVVVAQLRMLDAVADDHPLPVARLALRALGHERTDVQERALKLLRRLGPGTLGHLDPAELREAVGAVAPALRADAARLLGADHIRAPDAAVEASTPTGWAPVEPVRDVDALGELLSRALEGCDDPLDFDRCLDGLAWAARTGIDPSYFSAAAGRAGRRVSNEGFFGRGLPSCVAAVVVGWSTGTEIKPPHPDLIQVPVDAPHDRSRPKASPWFGLFPAARAYELSVRLAHGRPTAVVSFPTDAGGAVSPAALGARFAEAAAHDWAVAPIDAAQAALRLDPARRAEALAAAGPGRQALEAVFTRNPPPPAVSLQPMAAQLTPNWRAVLVQCEPATYGTLADPASMLCALGQPFEDLYALLGLIDHRAVTTPLAACMPLIAPHHAELVWAHAHFPASLAIEDRRADAKPYLLRLLADPAPFGPIATELLALALSAAEQEARALAADVLGAGAADGRLDARALGRTVGALVGGTLMATRLAPALRDAARISTVAAGAVLDVLEEAMPRALDARGGGELLAVAADLVADLGRPWPHPDILQPLLAKGGASRAAKEARRLAAWQSSH